MTRAPPMTWVLICVSLLGCGPGGGDAAEDASCANEAPDAGSSCIPAFDPPTFSAIYANVLGPRCGSPGTAGSCHGPTGQQGGLLLWAEEAAYESLTGEGRDNRARVVPGRPACGELMRRLQSPDPDVRMPLRATPLTAPELCAIRIWIEAGAAAEAD